LFGLFWGWYGYIEDMVLMLMVVVFVVVWMFWFGGVVYVFE